MTDSPAPPGAPNILLIVADDIGVANIGAYRAAANPPPTPNLDALAARGVLFRSAYASPVCSPSRACIQTGRYSFRTGVGTSILPGSPWTPALPLAEWTLPEVLDRAASGYRHAAIGKWHLGDAATGGDLAPNRAGWSHFAGLLHGAVLDHYSWPRTVNGVTATSSDYTTTRMVDDALAWIQAAPRPWLCTLCLAAPHAPYHAPPSGLHTYNLTGLDPRITPIPFYKAAIEAMDSEIGRLLRGLGSALAATNVLFIGDNGTAGDVVEPPYSPMRAKGTAYEGGIHVPLIAAGPDVNGGRQESALVSAVDLFATIAELCGVEPARVLPPGTTLDGASFARHLRQANQTPSRLYAFAESFLGTMLTQTGATSLRDGRYKIIRSYHPTLPSWDELFDLTQDPLETTNLLRGPPDPDQREAYLTLRSVMEQLRASR